MTLFFKNDGKYYKVEPQYVAEVNVAAIQAKLDKVNDSLTVLPKRKTTPDLETLTLWNKRYDSRRAAIIDMKQKLESELADLGLGG